MNVAAHFRAIFRTNQIWPLLRLPGFAQKAYSGLLMLRKYAIAKTTYDKEGP